MKAVPVQNNVKLLAGSSYDATPPNEISDYDDWFGAPEFNWSDKAYEFGGWDD